jgi:hypothetical protein
VTSGASYLIDNITITEALPDNSGQDNHLQVIGQLTREQFGTSGLYGIVIDQENYVQGTVTDGGQLIGEERDTDWIFRRSTESFYDADDTGGNLVIKGLVDTSDAAMLTYNGVAMTDEELDKVEQDNDRLENGIRNPIESTYSLNDLRFAALRAQGYLGHTNDMLRYWLADNGAGYPLIQINDMWKAFLVFHGYPVPTYQYNDAWYQFLGDQGYTQGHINDREVEFWRNGGVIIFGGSGSFGTAFSDAFG